MNIKHKIGLSCALALTVAACGSNTLVDEDAGPVVTPGPDAAAAGPDAAITPVADPYVWVVVQDTEQNACTTNGPGADIDAVAKTDIHGTPVGWGLLNSAKFIPNPGGTACDNVNCPKSNCKYASISSTFTEADLVSRTEGPQDATVSATGDDTGYMSLNAGTLEIQIGDAVTGAGPARAIVSGDYITVYEVDQTYITSGAAPATCTCAPEHYTVSIENADGSKILPLQPVLLLPDNADSCDSLTADPTHGCGTTTFMVP